MPICRGVGEIFQSCEYERHPVLFHSPCVIQSPDHPFLSILANKMSLVTSTLVLVLLPIALGGPVAHSRPLLSVSLAEKIHERDNSFVWGSLGDSWASGVSSSQDTHYDGDKYDCHRWKDSYGPIMERTTTWTTGLQSFHFAACMMISPHYVNRLELCS